jgi:tetratricopeptide (TPR) repeat protein
MASPHFELYTDAGAVDGGMLLRRCEEIHRVFEKTPAEIKNSELTTRVYLFAREREFDPFRPSPMTQAFYQGGPEHDYIVLWDRGPSTVRILFHEYTHVVLNHSAIALPTWLDEGLAEFYSTVSIDGTKLRIGEPIPGHLIALEQDWLPIGRFLSIGKNSPDYNGDVRTGTFYAQSWAFVHMLNMSPRYRGHLRAFFELLGTGMAQPIAFHRAFGQTMEDALESLKTYVRHPLATAEFAAPPEEAYLLSEPQPLTAAEAVGIRADLFLATGRGTQARALYEKMLRRAPNSPEAHAGLAIVALHDKRYADAKGLFEQAIRLGDARADTYFEYAMLLRRLDAPRDRVDDYLQRAIAANPSLAEAQFIVGVRASDQGRYAEAVEHLRRATEILPRQAYFWHALAFAYYKLGEMDLARMAAERVLSTANTPEEREMAAAAMHLTRETPARPLGKPSVETPSAWNNRKGDARVEGVLNRVDCEGRSARLHILAGGKEMVLTVEDPSTVVLRGARRRTTQFSCGAQPAIPVAIEYLSATKVVTAIEFP